MTRISDITPDQVVPFHGRSCAALDDVGFCAWIAQAEPGDTLIYHCGFLAVDTTAVISKLPTQHQRGLRQVAAAAMRAADQDFVHLVQSRIGPDQFAYIAIARRRPRAAGVALSLRLLESEAA